MAAADLLALVAGQDIQEGDVGIGHIVSNEAIAAEGSAVTTPPLART